MLIVAEKQQLPDLNCLNLLELHLGANTTAQLPDADGHGEQPDLHGYCLGPATIRPESSKGHWLIPF
jgi:hypothetical protein